MPAKATAQRILQITSQDPLTFCLAVAADIQQSLDYDFDANLDLEKLRRLLFVNKGWRLTRNGADIICANYKHYTSSSDENRVITGKILLNMDNCVGGPWFLRGNQITVFDPHVHFEMQMVNGNLNNFIDLKSSK